MSLPIHTEIAFVQAEIPQASHRVSIPLVDEEKKKIILFKSVSNFLTDSFLAMLRKFELRTREFVLERHRA